MELPATSAPSAAPPMISISCGSASRTGPSAPPVNGEAAEHHDEQDDDPDLQRTCA